MKITLFILSSFVFIYVILITILPNIAIATSNFTEEFNGDFTYPSRWTIYENANKGGNFSFTPEKIRLESDGGAFPFLHTDSDIFPENNFEVEIKFQYLRSGPAYGDGFAISNNIPPNGTTHTGGEHGIFYVWQDPAHGLLIQVNYLCPETNPGCPLERKIIYQTNTTDLNEHTFKVKYNDQKYRLFLDDINLFNSVSTLIKPSGIWLGNTAFVGPNKWSSFEVDYIHIKSLGNTLDVPHFSQLDPSWANDEYDFAANWINDLPIQDRNIGKFGCAMTSAAMVLNYHGYDHTSGYWSTNPQNINNYLRAETLPPPPLPPNVKGFDKDGGVIWSSFTDFAKEASSAGAAKIGSPKLEFDWPDFSFDTIRQDIENGQPVIIEIVMNENNPEIANDDNLHFVVAKGITDDNQVLIEDPLDLTETTQTLQEKYPGKKYQSLRRFIKSNTDLSYVWFYLYSQNINMLVEHQGKFTGLDKNGNLQNQIANAKFIEEGVIADDQNQNSGAGDGWGPDIYLEPKPDQGNYLIHLFGDPGQTFDGQIFVYKKDGASQQIDLSGQLNPNGQSIHLVNIDPNPDGSQTLAKEISFPGLISLINELYNKGKIKNLRIKNLLIKLTEISEKFYHRHFLKPSKKILTAELKLASRAKPFFITKGATVKLKNYIQLLKNNL